ncbi:MAG: pirin family protein [Flavisolibacter sp.]|jgi:redox-sensitive bicupin YhaK (pirin superfamily)
MNYRNVTVYKELQHFNVGPFQVKQPLPNSKIDSISPFILLHHAGPTHHAPGEIKARLSPHPHRGFEPVTFLFSGKIHHKDSTGSEGFLEAGDVQWMTAGSGIIHSEGPSTAFAKEGGDMELIQLWVNLPREHKMTTPEYQDIKKNDIPVIKESGFQLKVVAGTYKGVKGPASTFTPIVAMMMNFKAGASTIVEIPAGYNAMAYVLAGALESNGVKIDVLNMAVFDHSSEQIQLKATTDGNVLFLAGEPINEPVVSYGPFVMNYPGDIKQAIMDYETGKMGVLES